MVNHDQLYQAVFGEARQKEKYKYVPHNFKGMIAGKQYCPNCGLIRGNSKFSQWAVDKGCMNDLHSDYQRMRKRVNKG